jgi:hypothetical protein
MNTMIKVTTLIIMAGISLQAQIIIKTEDFDFQFNAGNNITEFYNASVSTIDAGSGTTTSWDFSNISADSAHSCNIVSAGTTPFRSDYPSANVAFEYDSGSGIVHNWEFYCRSFYYAHLHGLVYSTENQGSVRKLIYDPIKIYAAFPLTFGTVWKDTVIEIEKILENDVEVYSGQKTIITSASVDSYGMLTFPGGKTADALRTVIRETIKGEGTTEYKLFFQWFTKNGETLIAESDTASNSGMVNVHSIKWVINSPSTDVAVKPAKPQTYKLDQNYPNPFNPATIISYSVPEESDVEIRIYNSIGREVTQLVNERKETGTYTAAFSGEGLASGIYFAKMSAGNFQKTVKMTLIK